jgi:glucose/arabinose dehydrogenase
MLGASIAAGFVAMTPSPRVRAQATHAVTGSSRLAWDQEVASAADLQDLQFVLMVNGAGEILYEVHCDPFRGHDGFTCTAPLPALPRGTAELQLIAVAADLESEPSLPLHVVAAAELVAFGPATASRNGTRSGGGPADIGCRVGAQVCAFEAIDDEPLGDPTLLAVLPDGRALVGEAGRVLVLGKVLQPALELPRGARVVGLAVDPQFAITSWVFVGWTERAGAQQHLHITRYREVAGTLGEGATILTGIPVLPDSHVPMAVDRNGLVYAALPRAQPVHEAISGGVVLRVASNGRVPFETSQLSPIVSSGYARPEDLTIDVASGVVWLTGSDTSARPQVSTLGSSSRPRDVWPLALQAAAERAEPAERGTSPRTGRDQEGVLVVAGSRVYRGVVSGAGTPTFAGIQFDAPVRVRDVARHPDDSWVLLVEGDRGEVVLGRLRIE